MSPSIGVAIATCNGESFLAEQLESIFLQSRRPELISISDDCSSDRTLKIIENFQARETIPIVLNTNSHRLGVIENFLIAFENCNTDYICWCDQDDFWEINKLETLSDLVTRESVSLAFHTSEIVGADLGRQGRVEPWGLQQGLYSFPFLPDSLWGYGHQMMFSHDVIEIYKEMRGSKIAHLRDFCRNMDKSLLVSAGMAGSIYFFNSPLVKFRRHSSSVSKAGKYEPDNIKAPRRREIYMDDISRQISLIEALSEWLPSANMDWTRPNQTGEEFSCFLTYLEESKKFLILRQHVFSDAPMLNKWSSFFRLIFCRRYGGERQKKFAFRKLGIDLIYGVLDINS